MAPPSDEEISDVLRKAEIMSQASLVLIIITTIERSLEVTLVSHMPNLGTSLGKELFGVYGPLGSLKARIDIAFAFGFINEDVRRDLHTVRAIRNCFAHPKGIMHFDAKEVRKLVARFDGYKPETDPLPFFRRKADECIKAINAGAVP